MLYDSANYITCYQIGHLLYIERGNFWFKFASPCFTCPTWLRQLLCGTVVKSVFLFGGHAIWNHGYCARLVAPSMGLLSHCPLHLLHETCSTPCVVCCVSFAVRRVRLRQGLNYWLGFNKFNCTPHRTAALWPPVGEQWTAQRAIKCGLATSLGLGIGSGSGIVIGGTRLWPGKKQCHKLHLLLLLLLSMSTILFVRPLIKHSLTCSPVKQINQQSHRQTERLREREIARQRGREIGQIGEV